MIRAICLLTMLLGVNGCGAGGGGAGGALNQLSSLPDTDGDGFPEIEPPAGVAFDPATALALRISNTITRSQAESASGVSLPSAVSGSVSLSVDTSVTLTYPGGVEQVLRGSFPLGPRDLVFEAACPESVEVLVTAVADTPVTSPQAVESFGPFVSDNTGGAQSFDCGGQFSVETTADAETGELVASVVTE